MIRRLSDKLRFKFFDSWMVVLVICLIAGSILACNPFGGDDNEEIDATPTLVVTPSPEPQETQTSTEIEETLDGVQSRELHLSILTPGDNIIVDSPLLSVNGVTSPDATVSVNGEMVAPTFQGTFHQDIVLDEGPNLIEVLASDVGGNEKGFVISAIYIAQGDEGIGMFGVVRAIEFMDLGLVTILIETEDGSQQLRVTEKTTIVLPGVQGVSSGDIMEGQFLSVLATEDGNGLDAERILVKPVRPVRVAHFVGAVVDLGVGHFVAVDRQNNRVAIELLTSNNPWPGQVVTSVLEQDFVTGELSTHYLETSITSLARLIESVRTFFIEEEQSNLEQRLADNISGHLDMLQRLHGQLPISNREGLRNTIHKSAMDYSDVLSEFNLDGPLMTEEGILTSIDLSANSVTVEPTIGAHLDLKVVDNSKISLVGKVANVRDLYLGQHVDVRYDPLTLTINTLDVSGTEVLDSVIVGSIIEDIGIGDGVVTSLNRKASNVSLSMIDTRIMEMTIEDNTTIRRDGLRVSIAEVKLGDVVMSGTRFDEKTLLLTTLILKEPVPVQIEGFVRGMLVTAAGEDMVTISTSDLRFASLTADSDTVVTEDGLLSETRNLSIGDRVLVSFGAVDSYANSIEVLPSSISKISGSITEVDRETFTIVIENRSREQKTLIISKKTKITGGSKGLNTFNDLVEGIIVDSAFYRPDSKEVLSIRLGSS